MVENTTVVRKVSNDVMTVTTSARGLQLAISLRREIVVGQPIDVAITLTNNESHEVVMYRIDGYQECKPRVVGPANTPCPLTNFGLMVFDEWAKVSQVAIPLGPGESKTWNINLSKVYEFSPAEYVLSLSLSVKSGPKENVQWGVFLEVKDVPFEVVPDSM